MSLPWIIVFELPWRIELSKIFCWWSLLKALLPVDLAGAHIVFEWPAVREDTRLLLRWRVTHLMQWILLNRLSTVKRSRWIHQIRTFTNLSLETSRLTRLRWSTLAWLAKHKFAKLFALNLAIYFISELANVLAKHGLLGKLAGVILLYPLYFNWIGSHGLVDDRFDVIFEFLHDILVLKLGDIVEFALNIGIEQGALLCWVAVFKALIPSESLELKIKVEDEERLSEVYVSIASIVTGLEVHGQVEIVKSVSLPLLDHV